MTTQVKKLAPQILDTIKNAKRILLHFHPNPDPDSVGSALAMYHALCGLGKEVTVIKGDSPMPVFLSHLPGFDIIQPKNWSEIDPTELDLFLILDAASLGQISRRTAVVFPSSLQTIVIDHHVSNEKFAQINLVAPEYPATAQILYELFREWKIKLTHDIALCLFIGLWGDTGSFKYPEVKSSTFRAAADLIEKAPDFSTAVFVIENNRTPEDFIFQALAFNSLQTLPGARVAYAAVAHDVLIKKGIQPENLDGGGLANFIKSIQGWEIGASFIETESGIVKASFRTRDASRFDVSKLAIALGGGGHPAAAGVAFTAPLPEVLDRFRQAVDNLYPELTKVATIKT